MMGQLLFIILGLGCYIDSLAAQSPRPDCICTAQFDPVCGVDGVTYSNSCNAACAGVAVAYKDACPSALTTSAPCFCTLEFAPVCGSDGITYGNNCQAACAGVTVVRNGECSGTTTQAYPK